MFLEMLKIVILSFFNIALSQEYMSAEVRDFKVSMENACSGGRELLTADPFFVTDKPEFKGIISRFSEYSTIQPNNMCDYLKTPKLFSAISLLQDFPKEKVGGATKLELLERAEEEISRKYYVNKLILLKENIVSIEQESIEKKRALDVEDFYKRVLIACLDIDCAWDLFDQFKDKIKKKKNAVVYGKKVKELIMEELDLSKYRLVEDFNVDIDFNYNNSSFAKKILEQEEVIKKNNWNFIPREAFALFSKDELAKILEKKNKEPRAYFMNFLTQPFKKSKNEIGFVRPEDRSQHFVRGIDFTSFELQEDVDKIREKYPTQYVVFREPSWESKKEVVDINTKFEIQEMHSDFNYFKVYGTVNTEKGSWFLLDKSPGNEIWIHKSQFLDSKSITEILYESELAKDVKFYESPNGTQLKRTSSDLAYMNFKSKQITWIDDELWILIDTSDTPDEMSSEKLIEKFTPKNAPIKNIWIKAFKENGEYNFNYYSKGC